MNASVRVSERLSVTTCHEGTAERERVAPLPSHVPSYKVRKIFKGARLLVIIARGRVQLAGPSMGPPPPGAFPAPGAPCRLWDGTTVLALYDVTLAC